MTGLEELKREVEALKELVAKQQGLLARTGQQVIELRVNQQRASIRELDGRNKELQSELGKPSTSAPRSEKQGDYLTNDDVVELVQELQGQLDIIDDRSARRIVNARATGVAPIDALANSAGDYPTSFPKTYKDFVNLEQSSVSELSEFYELLPPDASEIQEMLKSANMTAEEAGVPKPEDSKSPNELFNDLARFLGLAARR